MNTDARSLRREQLLAALQARMARRAEQVAARDRRYGPDRIRITSYMENIGWPELFGFDMNRFFADPDFSVEMQLRQKIFWADNTDDDSTVDLSVQATTGMYYDMTLFGQRIRHTWNGVPEFEPHPLAHMAEPRPSDIPAWDFHATGDMPVLIAQYRRMCELAVQEYGGRLQVNFPCFHRGPLDIYVQMRGYDNFINDAAERPEDVAALLELFVDARLHFARARARFLGERNIPATSFVADDWVNIPFIAPRMFGQFAVPAYRRIEANEGPVTGFHTCGNFERVVNELLAVFPHIRRLEVSGWNDVRRLDELVQPQVGFDVAVINTLVLAGSEEEQRTRLQAIAEVGRHRPVSLCAQAMVKMNSYEETVARLNRFTTLAQEVFAAT
ncbi:MAG: hypothetical protein M1546_15470 [Chloroflexi bacterium]|nr:hypothetical protein [Chloroflexota bacterium]